MNSAARRRRRVLLVVITIVTTASWSSIALGQSRMAGPSAPASVPVTGPEPLAVPRPTGATRPVDDVAAAIAARLTTSTYTTDTTDAAIDALDAAGITVVDDPGATDATDVVPGTGRSPLRLLAFQAHSLAVDTWSVAGYTGEQLDATFPLPEADETRMPSAAQLLAGYVAASPTEGAAISRALMTGQDLTQPAQARFPLLTLFLFLGDLSRGKAARHQHAGRASLGLAALATAGGLCGDSRAFIEGSVRALFDAIKIASPKDLPGRFLTSVWNWLVDRGRAFVEDLAAAITAPVLGVVRSIAAGIATIAESVASILPYAVSVRLEQADGVSSVIKLQPDAATSGVFVATVTAGDLPDWPSVLQDCADAARIRLPDFHPGGAPVTWGPVTGDGARFLSGIVEQTGLDNGGEARWTFIASTDPGAPPGTQQNASVEVPVAVHRPELAGLPERLSAMLTAALPMLVAPFVQRLFLPIVGSLGGRIQALLDAPGVGRAWVVYHDRPTPTPTPTSTGRAAVDGWDGTWASEKYPLSGTFHATWHRQGTTISGSVVISGSRCGVRGGPLHGHIHGDRVTFGTVAGSTTVTWQGTIDGDGMSGTFADGSRCGNDHGTFQGQRVTP